MTQEHILTERHGDVLAITLDRAERLNAAPPARFEEIAAALADLGGTRAVLFTGAASAGQSTIDVLEGLDAPSMLVVGGFGGDLRHHGRDHLQRDRPDRRHAVHVHRDRDDRRRRLARLRPLGPGDTRGDRARRPDRCRRRRDRLGGRIGAKLTFFPSPRA